MSLNEQALNDQCRWPLDPTTSALFGALVAEERTSRQLSFDVLASESRKSEEWFTAVESGQVRLTYKQVNLVGHALCQVGEFIDLHQKIHELQREPFGDLAKRLRAHINLVGWADGASASNSSPEVTFVAESVSPTDRVLVFGPVGFLVAIAILSAQTLAWAIGGDGGDVGPAVERWVSLLNDVVLSAAVVAGVASALSLRTTERLLSRFADKGRNQTRRQDLAAVHRLLSADGIDSTHAGWRMDAIIDHVVLKHRETVRKASIRASFAERVEPAIVIGVAISLTALVASVEIGGITWDDLLPALVLAFLVLLWRLILRECDSAAGVCAGEVSRGLGWKLGAAQSKAGLRGTIRY